ncbi:MAG: MaoC family dehydratase [Rhodospirillaceae bacterium]|nr:MaoC family dehydratase [Rhodospirillaceae bacterium]
MQQEFDQIDIGLEITGRPFTVTRETIADFALGSLDFNPLHFDDDYMKEQFGKTKFKGVIMHGMQNFAVITRTLTDWLLPKGGYYRRLETRWLSPVYLGDTITVAATVQRKLETDSSRWVVFAINVSTQDGTTVAAGEAMAEFADVFPGAPG